MHGKKHRHVCSPRHCCLWPQKPTSRQLYSGHGASKVNNPSGQVRENVAAAYPSNIPIIIYYSSSPPMNHQDISRNLTIYFSPFYAGPVLSARSRSAMRSSTSSMPTDIRTRSSVRPRSLRTAAGIAAWDMKHGRLMRDFTLPELRKCNGSSQSRVQ